MTMSERRTHQKRRGPHVRFGLRRLVEIVMSAFKRVYGESVRTLLPHAACVGVAAKMAAYNCTLNVGASTVRFVRAA